MSYLRKIEYKMEPTQSFHVVRNCAGCGTKANYINTGRFRVNANGNKLDVWLIYQCEKCKHTFNLSIYERKNPGKIPQEEYEKFLENNEELAAEYGKSLPFFARNRAEVEKESVVYGYKAESGEWIGTEEQTAYRKGDLIVVHNPYGMRVRVEKQVAEILNVSRSQVKKIMEKNEIEVRRYGEYVEIEMIGDEAAWKSL